MAENDWAGISHADRESGPGCRSSAMTFCHQPYFIRRGISGASGNAVLIKLNQIGTVTETIEAIEICREAGGAMVISHRSGETEDRFIADFAVAMGGGRSRPGRSAAASGSRNTTGCSKSSGNWAAWPSLARERDSRRIVTPRPRASAAADRDRAVPFAPSPPSRVGRYRTARRSRAWRPRHRNGA